VGASTYWGFDFYKKAVPPAARTVQLFCLAIAIKLYAISI
jgi:hypothetical protein